MQEAVLDRGADESRRRLGPEAQAVATAVLETVHFLLDDVGVLADRPLEQLGTLDHRHAHFAVAVVGEQFARGGLDPLPVRQLVGEQVVHPADGLELLRHGVSFASATRRRRPAAAANH